ncbi:PAS domain-containing sensor histidine kinase [Rhodocytophaga aerolata]|uniref:histidine kinase n=1 Tax=Rhodocytophaga aerolata TaxID=455078 RepID=A0ABT8R7B0_9BACT|nr:PAS domain-containing sensor histidine kinase [Rhodocytophaga aerolata]MDO1447219.1 PAS domain-containing sensor histidine kinase [Rhodocytophaga aerolata]
MNNHVRNNDTTNLVSENQVLKEKVKTYEAKIQKLTEQLETRQAVTTKSLADNPAATENENIHPEMFYFLAESIPQIVWTALPDGYEDFHNKKLTEYSGISVEEAEGDGWQQIIHPEDYAPTLAIWDECLRTGQPYQVKYRFRRHDGEYRWFLGRALPLKDVSGKIIKWFGTCTDIHEEELAKIQLQDANQELKHINEVLDNFVYMAAHDLKSPVSSLKMLLHLLDMQTEIDKKEEFIRMVNVSVDRLERTISGLIEVIFVESSQSPAKEIAFDEMLANIITELGPQMDSCKDCIEADFRVPSIKYIEAYLSSIMKNLITNAVKYYAPRRPLAIHIQTKKVDDAILLTVTDNGIGIDLIRNKDKVFKPFKRFTERAHGTGVGLYIIKNIVEKNGGTIEIESQPDKGTTFRVYLKAY